MKLKRLTAEEFSYIYHKVPRAGVDIILKTDQGVLLAKRSIYPFKGTWCLPGGTILFREPIEHAIKRIAEDELGVEVRIKEHLGIIDYLHDGYRHTVSNAFLVEVDLGKLISKNQATGFQFFKKLPVKINHYQKDFLLANSQNIFGN